ncbi:MAG TPA: prephenate dehydrogenase/arogenate dehydrogenase family protein [bacterium]
MPRFDRVTIIGLGLIGGSLGLALKRRKLARRVIGVTRSARSLRLALRRGAIDGGTADLREGVQGAALTVLAVPVDVIVPIGRAAAARMGPGGVLTDVGSVKAGIVRALERLPRSGPAFVGAHPVAGSERRGIEAADAELFAQTLGILTPTARTDERAVRVVGSLWRAVGQRIVLMDPAAHDSALADLSHLPHVVAAALAASVRPGLVPQVPRSLLDMTRIANSDPGLWDDILAANRGAVLASLRRFERSLRALRDAVRRGDRGAIRRRLARARLRREALER